MPGSGLHGTDIGPVCSTAVALVVTTLQTCTSFSGSDIPSPISRGKREGTVTVSPEILIQDTTVQAASRAPLLSVDALGDAVGGGSRCNAHACRAQSAAADGMPLGHISMRLICCSQTQNPHRALRQTETALDRLHGLQRGRGESNDSDKRIFHCTVYGG
jgi:hypothetical protein